MNGPFTNGGFARESEIWNYDAGFGFTNWRLITGIVMVASLTQIGIWWDIKVIRLSKLCLLVLVGFGYEFVTLLLTLIEFLF